MRDGPLSHITVVDLTQFLSGPYATQILGDMGARVIKIEPPTGESTRNVPPHFLNGESAYYLSVNRNKDSLALDLKTPRGREILFELVAKADIVIENFRPGVTKRLGIDYEEMKRVNPRAVVCSISGFGQDGPYRDFPAYDIVVQAMSGGMSITGSEGGEPVRAGIPIGDLAAGMYAVIGVMGGLAKVQATGEGSYVDISMLDCQISMLSYQAAYYLMSGEVPGTQGRGHRSIPTYRAFRCHDGVEVVTAANTERMWELMCEALGCVSLVEDPRFKLNKDRLANRQELDPLLESAFAAVGSNVILPKLINSGVPAAPINTLDRALADPQVAHRQMVLTLDDDNGATFRTVGDPVKFTTGGRKEHRSPPRLGQDSRAILRDILGRSEAEIASLVEQGVVGA